MSSDLCKYHCVRFAAATLSVICPYPRAPSRRSARTATDTVRATRLTCSDLGTGLVRDQPRAATGPPKTRTRDHALEATQGTLSARRVAQPAGPMSSQQAAPQIWSPGYPRGGRGGSQGLLRSGLASLTLQAAKALRGQRTRCQARPARHPRPGRSSTCNPRHQGRRPRRPKAPKPKETPHPASRNAAPARTHNLTLEAKELRGTQARGSGPAPGPGRRPRCGWPRRACPGRG